MILLIGASATGKSEVAKCLLHFYGIKKAITHTTRPKREGEQDGIDYHFVDEKNFLSLWKNGELLENTLYNGNHYGCSKKEIQDDKCVILDSNGVNTFLNSHDPRLIVFYLTCSKETRKKRMEGRGDEEEIIQKRLKSDEQIFDPKRISHIDFYVDTEKEDAKKVADHIYHLYINELKSR